MSTWQPDFYLIEVIFEKNTKLYRILKALDSTITYDNIHRFDDCL